MDFFCLPPYFSRFSTWDWGPQKEIGQGFFWGGSNKSGCLGFFWGGGHSWQMWKPKVRKSFFPAFLEMRKRGSLCLEGTKISHLAYLASRLNVFSRSNIYIFGHTPRLPFKKPSNSNLVSHLPPRLVRIFMRRRWPPPHSYQICVKYFFSECMFCVGCSNISHKNNFRKIFVFKKHLNVAKLFECGFLSSLKHLNIFLAGIGGACVTFRIRVFACGKWHFLSFHFLFTLCKKVRDFASW